MDSLPVVAILLGAAIAFFIAATWTLRRASASFFFTHAFLQDSAPSILIDSNGRVRSANESAVRLLGIQLKVDPETVWSLLKLPGDQGAHSDLRPFLQDVIRGGGAWRGRVVVSRSGQERSVEAVCLPVRPRTTSLLRIHLSMSDGAGSGLPHDGVTAILDGSPDGIVVLRGDHIVYANGPAAHLFGYEDPKQMSSLDFLKTVVPGSRTSFGGSVLDNPVGSRVLTHAEVRGLSRSGRLLDLEVNARVITWNEDPALEVFLRDVTERKTLEREQALWRWEQDAMSEIDKNIAGVADAQTIFASIMSHGVGLVHADWATLLTVDDECIHAQRRASHGSIIEAPQLMALDVTLRQLMAQNDQTVIKESSVVGDALSAILFGEKLKTTAWTPLSMGAKRIGLLGIGYRTRREPGQRELRLLASLAEKSVIAIMNIREYERVLERERELETLSTSRVEAQEEERRRIAKEIHDGLGQMLTAIKFNLEILEDSVTSNEEARTRITDMKTLLDGLMQEAREMSYTLMPSVLDDFGLAPALQMLCEQFGRKHAINTVFQNHGLDARLQRLLEVSLYRIAQEALSNAAEHSEASSVVVQVIRRAQRIRLVIEDNGKGMDSEAKMARGIGFVSMRERASQFGGTLRVDTSPGEGTVITAEIPLTERNVHE